MHVAVKMCLGPFVLISKEVVSSLLDFWHDNQCYHRALQSGLRTELFPALTRGLSQALYITLHLYLLRFNTTSLVV